jgi:[protein-PII] uridylyltransferase
LCSELIQRIPKPEILYLAGLFHDIAKGRGGDHSELGADDARVFAHHHGLSEYDTRLLAWLVQNHLVMSTTAQRKDINDPEVITAFAQQVATQTRLDYLYLLTVADIRATNPNLWNSWRNSLLMELYLATSRAFRRGLSNPVDQRDVIRETKLEAMRLLRESGPVPERVDDLWTSFGDDYFVRYPADRVAWHTQAILHHDDVKTPLVLIQSQGQYGRGGTEVFIYTKDDDGLFAIVTTCLDQLALNIVDARIISTLDGRTLDTYTVLERDGTPIAQPARLAEIAETVKHKLISPVLPKRPTPRHLARQIKHFNIPTRITFVPEPNNGRTVMEVTTNDRPGLLAQISHAMMQCKVRLKNAKIATLGERVEDIFFITDENNLPLHDEGQRARLAETIRSYFAE